MSLCVRPHIKKYPEYSAFLTLKIIWSFAGKVCETIFYKHAETIGYVKK